MTATQIRSPGPADTLRADDGSTGAGRPIRPRRGLPSGRAVVGGLLVAVAAVGTFAAASGAGRGAGTPVVVAAHDLAPGTVLGEADVELMSLDLPPGLTARTFTAPGQVRGAVTVGPLAAGELVQAGGLADGADGAVPTFALALPTAAANGGRLQRGDRVQVFATYGRDATAVTRLLAAEARVVDVDEGDADLGASGQIQVLLAIRDAEERSRVINATTSGTVTLVRTTGAGSSGAFPSYRPDLGSPPPASAEPSGDEPPTDGDR